MIMETEDKKTLIRYRIGQAEETIEDVRGNAGFYYQDQTVFKN
ncbi:MAG: hypothetical protein R6V04_00025 [bacterium]